MRGDGHFANPELVSLCETDAKLDLIFGLAGNKALSPKAEPLLNKARSLLQTRRENANRCGDAPPTTTLLYGDIGS